MTGREAKLAPSIKIQIGTVSESESLLPACLFLANRRKRTTKQHQLNLFVTGLTKGHPATLPQFPQLSCSPRTMSRSMPQLLQPPSGDLCNSQSNSSVTFVQGTPRTQPQRAERMYRSAVWDLPALINLSLIQMVACIADGCPQSRLLSLIYCR